MIPNYPYELTSEYLGLHAPQFMSVEVEFLELCGWLIEARGYKTFLEIGTLKGEATWFLNQMARTQKGTVVTVDIARDPEIVQRNYPQTTFVTADSKHYLKETRVGGRKFDFVLVDGDHNEEAALSDVHGSLKVLSPGGAIAIHDTALMDGVKAAMEKLKKEFDLRHWLHLPFGKGLSILMP